MIEEGQKVKVTVEKLSLGGDGIARAGGLVLFVPYSAPGDELEVLVTVKKKTFGRAKVLSILKPGPTRVARPCPYYFNSAVPAPACGGCNLQHLNYRAQLDAKVQSLKETFQKIAGVSPDIEAPLAMEEGQEWRYRNKMQLPFAKDAAGKVVAGFYAAVSHNVVPLADCLIHSEQVAALVNFLVQKMNDWGLEPYSEKTHSGWLRHAVIRESFEGKLLLAFVTSSEIFPKKDEWIAELTGRFQNLEGIVQNINTEKTNVILAKTWRTLHGRDFLTESAGGIRLRISASSFFQVNTKMAEKLYLLARDWAGKGKILLDLYCGAGAIGILCAPNFESVSGADDAPSSIDDAVENLKMNSVPNCRFYRKDARDFLKDLPAAVRSQEITAVLDPPRAGCSLEVLKLLAKAGPVKIIYVSCDPGTLARDVKILISLGYRVEKVRPVDLFPQSSHIESVTLLVKS